MNGYIHTLFLYNIYVFINFRTLLTANDYYILYIHHESPYFYIYVNHHHHSDPLLPALETNPRNTPSHTITLYDIRNTHTLLKLYHASIHTRARDVHLYTPTRQIAPFHADSNRNSSLIYITHKETACARSTSRIHIRAPSSVTGATYPLSALRGRTRNTAAFYPMRADEEWVSEKEEF